MKLLYVMFIAVFMVVFNTSNGMSKEEFIFSGTKEELLNKCDDKKDTSACVELAIIYADEEDYTSLLIYSEKVCDGGNMEGCDVLGDLYVYGLGVEKNYDKALGLYSQACDGGEDLMGCDKFQDLYEKECSTDPKKYCSKYK